MYVCLHIAKSIILFSGYFKSSPHCEMKMAQGMHMQDIKAVWPFAGAGNYLNKPGFLIKEGGYASDILNWTFCIQFINSLVTEIKRK
jgi:hypothetical protein